MFRIIICGSRDYANRNHLNAVLDDTLERHPDLVIVEGGAQGADRLAFEWARSTIPHPGWERYPADWNRYGKSAGPRRNEQMLASMGADSNHPIQGVIAFFTDPANPSRGTSHMVRIAKEAGYRVYIPRTSCWGAGNCRPGDLCPSCWRNRPR